MTGAQTPISHRQTLSTNEPTPQLLGVNTVGNLSFYFIFTFTLKSWNRKYCKTLLIDVYYMKDRITTFSMPDILKQLYRFIISYSCTHALRTGLIWKDVRAPIVQIIQSRYDIYTILDSIQFHSINGLKYSLLQFFLLFKELEVAVTKLFERLFP